MAATVGDEQAPVRADPPAGRRRRRAVGPPGAAPDALVDRRHFVAEPDDAREPDDDARLLADVPPHHGT